MEISSECGNPLKTSLAFNNVLWLDLCWTSNWSIKIWWICPCFAWPLSRSHFDRIFVRTLRSVSASMAIQHSIRPTGDSHTAWKFEWKLSFNASKVTSVPAITEIVTVSVPPASFFCVTSYLRTLPSAAGGPAAGWPGYPGAGWAGGAPPASTAALARSGATASPVTAMTSSWIQNLFHFFKWVVRPAFSVRLRWPWLRSLKFA